MTPSSIIQQVAADGVMLALSPGGTLKAIGDEVAVNRWLPAIREHRDAILGALARAQAQVTAAAWLLRFADRLPLEVHFAPPATHAEVLAAYPEATGVEPLAPAARRVAASMTEEEKGAIRAWLASIGETDPETVAEVLHGCGCSEGVKGYFLGRATEAGVLRGNRPAPPIQPEAPAKSCGDCRHRKRPGLADPGYCAQRSDMPHAYGTEHPLHRLPEDGGTDCNQFEERE